MTRAVSQRLATMAPVMADGRHGTQIESGYRGNGIEPGLAFDANRLKGERVVDPADEAVSRDADTYRRPSGSADISAGLRTRAHPRSGREDGPAHGYIIGETDLRSEALNITLIVLGRSAARRHEHAVEYTRRKDDIACRSRASPVQHARLDVRLSGHRP